MDLAADDSSDAPCSVSEIIIPADDKGLYCDRFCKKYYDSSCVDITESKGMILLTK